MMRVAAFSLTCVILLLAVGVLPDAFGRPVPSACSTAGDAAALGIAAFVLAVAHGKARRRERENPHR
jgi:MYXO-CTERM domain-containing protein